MTTPLIIASAFLTFYTLLVMRHGLSRRRRTRGNPFRPALVLALLATGALRRMK